MRNIKSLIIGIILTGCIYIFLIPDEPLLMKILFKIIPMLLIITLANTVRNRLNQKGQLFILIGLVFGMIGDATIHWFILGLASFLISHLFYVGGFIKKWNFSLWRSTTMIPIILYAVLIGTALINGMVDPALKIPVIFYVAVISFMLWFSIMTGNRAAFIGALLFVISDSILAWNKFVAAIPQADMYIMLTYYTAQFFIAMSLAQQSKDKTVESL